MLDLLDSDVEDYVGEMDEVFPASYDELGFLEKEMEDGRFVKKFLHECHTLPYAHVVMMMVMEMNETMTVTLGMACSPQKYKILRTMSCNNVLPWVQFFLTQRKWSKLK